ncbi:hypothetical protein JCM5296_003783 [Sporobolomyces johnsonii]
MSSSDRTWWHDCSDEDLARDFITRNKLAEGITAFSRRIQDFVIVHSHPELPELFRQPFVLDQHHIVLQSLPKAASPVLRLAVPGFAIPGSFRRKDDRTLDLPLCLYLSTKDGSYDTAVAGPRHVPFPEEGHLVVPPQWPAAFADQPFRHVDIDGATWTQLRSEECDDRPSGSPTSLNSTTWSWKFRVRSDTNYQHAQVQVTFYLSHWWRMLRPNDPNIFDTLDLDSFPVTAHRSNIDVNPGFVKALPDHEFFFAPARQTRIWWYQLGGSTRESGMPESADAQWLLSFGHVTLEGIKLCIQVKVTFVPPWQAALKEEFGEEWRQSLQNVIVKAATQLLHRAAPEGRDPPVLRLTGFERSAGHDGPAVDFEVSRLSASSQQFLFRSTETVHLASGISWTPFTVSSDDASAHPGMWKFQWLKIYQRATWKVTADVQFVEVHHQFVPGSRTGGQPPAVFRQM